MGLIKCTECGHDVSDKASACPNCGCPIQAADNTSVKEMEVKPLYVKEGNGKKWALLALLFLIIGGGCYLISRSSNDTLNDDNRINTVDTEPIYRDIASVNLSPKGIITNSLEELFNDVMIGKDGNGPEYDEKYFSTDFNRIYKEVEEIDMGYDGFFKAKFWDMEKDEVEMSISLEDVYNIKDNEAIAKVSFKISSSGYTKNLNEEIKVILENDKWVLDDIHGYKKQMEEYVVGNNRHIVSKQSNQQWNSEESSYHSSAHSSERIVTISFHKSEGGKIIGSHGANVLRTRTLSNTIIVPKGKIWIFKDYSPKGFYGGFFDEEAYPSIYWSLDLTDPQRTKGWWKKIKDMDGERFYGGKKISLFCQYGSIGKKAFSFEANFIEKDE